MGKTRKMSQQYFCPVYTIKTKPKTTKSVTLNLTLKKKKNEGLGLWLVLGLILGFGLVCTPLGKYIVGSFIPHFEEIL